MGPKRSRESSGSTSPSESQSSTADTSSTQQITYHVSYLGRTLSQPAFGPLTVPKLIKHCRLAFRLDSEAQLQLNDGDQILAPESVLGPGGSFLLEKVEKEAVLTLSDNETLERFKERFWENWRVAVSKTQTLQQRVKTITYRRAFSLTAWRCILKVDAITEATDTDAALFDDALISPEEINNVDLELPEYIEAESSTFRDASEREARKLHRADDENEEKFQKFFHVPVAFCRAHLKYFSFSSDALVEVQFQHLWGGILSAAIGVRCKSFTLHPEYLMRHLVPDPKISPRESQKVDFIISYQECKSPFAAIFVEIAGSRINKDDDHKDFQKMIGCMARYLTHLIGRMHASAIKVDKLENLRVFGIFITRFAYDFVAVKPFFTNDDPTTAAFIVEVNREWRDYLVDDRTLTITETPPTLSVGEQIGIIPSEAIKAAKMDNEEREVTDDDPGSKEFEKSIHDALPLVRPENLKPLFKFGRLVRRYCYEVKSIYDEDLRLESETSLSSNFPEPLPSRPSAQQSTPARRWPESRPGLNQGSAVNPARGSIAGAVNQQILRQDDKMTVIRFQRPGSSLDWVLKQSRRATALNEVEMISRLSECRLVPFVESCEWDSEQRCSRIVSEHLVESCPDVGPGILSRSMDQLCFMRDLIQSLMYLHVQRIIHRDISAANAMYSLRERRYKLMDFEFACVLSADQSCMVDQHLVGTEPFIDAVVLETKQYSFLSDWCSLGLVCEERIRIRLWVDMWQWESIPAVSDLIDDIYRVAAAMTDCRKTAIEFDPQQLLGEIQSIMNRIVNMEECSSCNRPADPVPTSTRAVFA